MKKSRYLSAKEATEILGISTATLYAYVSRGLIRSEVVEGARRAHRYHAEDVDKLKAQKEQRKNPREAARNALHWGTPLLESALTLITDDGLYYRGHDALELATTHSVEQVAALFWTGNIQDAERLFTLPAWQPVVEKCLKSLQSLPTDLSLIHRLQIALTLASADDLAAYDFQRERVAQTGGRILRLMGTVIAGENPTVPAITQLLTAGWHQADAQAADLFEAALILCADHELNVSSFTARVVASAEAQPYLAVLAGLAALQGLQHGGSVERAEALLREIDDPRQADRIIEGHVRRGEKIPGFGHRLYPDGDPRARLLLHLLDQAYPDTSPIALAHIVALKLHGMLDLAPNIDFALAVLAQTLRLPAGAALALFALGRTIGWIGHAIEQYAQQQLIRPRAMYIGVPVLKKRDVLESM